MGSQYPDGFNAQAVDRVLQRSESKGNARLVLVALARRYNEETRTAFDSNENIGAYANIRDAGTIRRAKRELSQLGELVQLGATDRKCVPIFRIPLLEDRVEDNAPHTPYDSLDHFLSSSSSSSKGSMGGNIPDVSRLFEDWALRLSYAFSDLAIERGRKSSRYRDDARTVEWLRPMHKVVSEFIAPSPPLSRYSIAEVVGAFAEIMDRRERLTQPVDMRFDDLRDALSGVRSPGAAVGHPEGEAAALNMGHTDAPGGPGCRRDSDGCGSFGSGDFEKVMALYDDQTRSA